MDHPMTRSRLWYEREAEQVAQSSREFIERASDGRMWIAPQWRLTQQFGTAVKLVPSAPYLELAGLRMTKELNVWEIKP